jgi:predicted nucleotidyltransferase component of viral defense system
MKKFHLLTPAERQTYLQETSAKTGIQPSIIEKDYWVVWTLWLLFNQDDLKPSLTFKGGTSLSKAFSVIQRFSEDIDLSIEKSFFGMTDDQSPENAPSIKKRSQALKDLSAACKEYVQMKLARSLSEQISSHLGKNSDWDLKIDPDDNDGQTLLFTYPTSSTRAASYISSVVKIEMGARSEHWPVSQRVISSYLKDTYKDKIDEPEVEVKVLNVERTFWEKATILHQYFHIPESKAIPLRLSRHYYDFYKLLNSSVKAQALESAELLDRVAKHKDVYFHSSWANYVAAKKGSLKLMPSDRILSELQKDYKLMRDMFFEEPPEWEAVIEAIRGFEGEFNL